MADAGRAIKLLARSLRELSKVPSKISAPLAAFVTADLKRTLSAGTDPYGNPLKPLAASTIRKKGHARILQETGALLSSLAARPLSGGGLTLYVGPWYAAFHSLSRPFFPLYALPKQWRAEGQRLLSEAAKEALP